MKICGRQNKLLQGFSLIEILVAAAIASVLAIILYRAFSQTTAVVRRVNNQIEENGQTLSTGAQLEKDFSAIFMPFTEEVKKEKPAAQAPVPAVSGQQPAPQVESVKEEKKPEIIPLSTTTAEGKLATISFVTTNAFALLDEVTPRCVRVVYRFAPQEAQAEGTLYRLVREEMPYNQKAEIEKRVLKPQHAYTLLRNIQSYQVEFSTTACEDSDEVVTLKEWGTPTQKKKCPKAKIPAYIKISYSLSQANTQVSNEVTHFLTIPAGLCPQEEKTPAKAPEESVAATPAATSKAQTAAQPAQITKGAAKP